MRLCRGTTSGKSILGGMDHRSLRRLTGLLRSERLLRRRRVLLLVFAGRRLNGDHRLFQRRPWRFSLGVGMNEYFRVEIRWLRV